jgi:hypothetical protein
MRKMGWLATVLLGACGGKAGEDSASYPDVEDDTAASDDLRQVFVRLLDFTTEDRVADMTGCASEVPEGCGTTNELGETQVDLPGEGAMVRFEGGAHEPIEFFYYPGGTGNSFELEVLDSAALEALYTGFGATRDPALSTVVVVARFENGVGRADLTLAGPGEGPFYLGEEKEPLPELVQSTKSGFLLLLNAPSGAAELTVAGAECTVQLGKSVDGVDGSAALTLSGGGVAVAQFLCD